jgi:hypothetical protein
MVMCRDQNAGRSHNINTDNSSFEKVEEFNIWEQPERIKMLFRKKLRADLSHVVSFGAESFVFQLAI